MDSAEFEYRGHLINLYESGSSNGKKTFNYSIEKRLLRNGDYSRKWGEYYSVSEVIKAAKEAVDLVFSSVEKQAAVERELTKKDFDGFVALLANSKLPSEQISVVAVEMLKAHYQRLNVIDNSDVARSIEQLADRVQSSFCDLYGNSHLSGIVEALKENTDSH